MLYLVCASLLWGEARSALEPSWSGIQWIGGYNQLRSTFDVPSTASTSATLLVTSLGIFEPYLNGQRIGNSVLDPGFSTVYSHRVLYREYPVTLKAGERNVLGFRIGTGKYGFMQTYCAAGQTKCVGVKAQLLLSNGHRLVCTNATSNTWLGTSSPWAPDEKAYPRRTLWDGAVYNASLDLDGWSASGFDVSGWGPALLITPPVHSDPEITPHDMPPMIKTPRGGIKPVSSWISPKGTLVADFGANMAGYLTIQLPARTGGGAYTVMIKHAEMLTGPKGSTQNQYTVPPHSAKDCAHYGSCAYQVDTYHLPSTHTDKVLEPSFTYHGFRYVEVVVEGEVRVEAEMLRAYFVHTDVDTTATFSSNNSQLNALQASILHTVLSNLHSVPTDCPTREKRGWMGDGQWSAENNVVNFDMRAVYRNWARTIADTQAVGCTHASKQDPPPSYCINHPLDKLPSFLTTTSTRPPCYLCCDRTVTNAQRFGCYTPGGEAGVTFDDVTGAVPGVVPFDNVAGWPADPAWGAATVVVPYAVWKHNENVTVQTQAAYPMMRQYAEFLLNHLTDGLVQFGMLGDWNPLAQAPPKPMSAAFYGIISLQLVAEVAGALGNHADQTRYAAKAADMRDKFHATFFNHTSGSYGDDCCQGCHVLPIVAGVVPRDLLPQVTASLVRSMYCYHNDAKQVAITGGGVTTRYIFEALERVGREDLGLELATKTEFPSFGYMLAQGPGTIWERWSGSTFVAPGGSSKNHHMFSGGVGRFLYTGVAGISTQVQNRSGTVHRLVVARPSLAIMRVVGSAAATVPSPWGETSISWKYLPPSNTVSHLDGVESWQVNVSTPVRRAILTGTGLPSMRLQLPLTSLPCTTTCTTHDTPPCLSVAVRDGVVSSSYSLGGGCGFEGVNVYTESGDDAGNVRTYLEAEVGSTFPSEVLCLVTCEAGLKN